MNETMTPEMVLGITEQEAKEMDRQIEDWLAEIRRLNAKMAETQKVIDRLKAESQTLADESRALAEQSRANEAEIQRMRAETRGLLNQLLEQ